MQRTLPSAFVGGFLLYVYMNITDRIKAFSTLGLFLKQFVSQVKNKDLSGLNKESYDNFLLAIEQAEIYNRWFVKDNRKDYTDRLTSAGFKVTEFHWESDPDFGGEDENKYILYKKEAVFFCLKKD